MNKSLAVPPSEPGGGGEFLDSPIVLEVYEDDGTCGGRLLRGHGELSGCTGWMARADDDRAKQTIAEAGRILGLGLANLVSIRNPQIIVIGGGVAAAGNLLLTPARQPYANGLNRSRRNRFVLCAAVWGAELEFWAPQSSVSMNARNEYDLSSS